MRKKIHALLEELTDNLGKIDILVSLDRSISIDDEYQIVPDIAEQTNIDVAFDALNTKEHIRGESTVSFSIDGNALSEIDETVEIKAGFHFFQDVDDNKDAKIGILGLTSIADSNESNPDLKIMGKYTLQGDTSSYDTEYYGVNRSYTEKS